jgi:acyl-ACP thioesterase
VTSVIPPFPERGRTYEEPRLVGPRETSPSGRARLDAIADWLQAIAFADVVDAGVEGTVLWIVRRVAIQVERFPRLGDRITVRTACSALGARWAERRTSLPGHAEAVALWVAIDPQTFRPARIDHLAGVYGESAGDRRARTGLKHPPPPPDAQAQPWVIRHADLDVGGHVNNAAYWQALEEQPDGVHAEIEHREPCAAEPATLLSHGDRRWIVKEGGAVCASFALTAP